MGGRDLEVDWDPRIGAFRANGYCYRALRAHLCRRGYVVRDSVFPHQEVARDQAPICTHPELRPYQREAMQAWLLQGARGMVILPTGAGKTTVALAALAAIAESALILVPTRALLAQWVASLAEAQVSDPGVIGDGQRRLRLVTVSTFASAYRMAQQIGNRFRLLVVDEAHHFGDAKQDEALEMFTAPYRLGLTATPPDEEDKKARLHALIGPVVYRRSLADLSGSYLAPFEHRVCWLRFNAAERMRYQQTYGVFAKHYRNFIVRQPGSEWQDYVRFARRDDDGRKALAGYFRGRRLVGTAAAKFELLRNLLDRHRDERGMIFTAETDTALEITRRFLVAPITADIKRAEREHILEAFRRGAIGWLTACRVLNEGIDVAEAQVAIIVGGTGGAREQVQRIGRMLRPKEGKRAMIYELIVRDSFEERLHLKRNSQIGQDRLPQVG